MARTACYIDGFNLYHAIDAYDKHHLKWLNLKGVCDTLIRPEDSLQSIVYFSAFMVWDQKKYQRHNEYIKAIKAVGVEPIMSKFLGLDKHCRRFDRYCSFREEKQTDVAFSSRVLCDVLSGGIERVVLITADSDQVPTVSAIRGLRPQVHISLVAPPGRISIAKELALIAHDSRELKIGNLELCLFPRNVRNARGQVAARCPAKYVNPSRAS